MVRKRMILLLLALAIGCTRYVYYGDIQADDSVGKLTFHHIEWTKTERLLWFDECSEVVRLQTDGSLEVVIFKETENGIILPVSSSYRKVINIPAADSFYGKILEAKKVQELGEGKLKLVIYCVFDSTEFTVGNHHVLKARLEPYEFPISRRKWSKSDSASKMPDN